MFPDLMRDDVFRLETRRLWLRWPRAADAVAIAKLAGEAEVAEMTANIPHPYPPGAAAEFVLQSRMGNLAGTSVVLMLSPRARPAETMGCISLQARDRGQAELGYWLGRPNWGQGLMTEAARTMFEVIFQITDLNVVTASARPGNGRSIGVLEACGFQRMSSGLLTAPARGTQVPVDHFRLTRAHIGRKSGSRERPLAAMQMQTA